MPGEVWGGTAGVPSLGGVAQMDLEELLLQSAFGGQPWTGAGQGRLFSHLCHISSSGSVRNNLDHVSGGALGEGDLRHLKRRDRVTLGV